MADWLSRAVMVNAIEEGSPETSGDVRQFLRRWTPEGEGVQGAAEKENADQSLAGECLVEERAAEMEMTEKIIKDKLRQVIRKTKTTDLMKVEYAKYGN